jgi:hypothetical protein
VSETCSEDDDGGEERGEESGSEWCIFTLLISVLGGGVTVRSDSVGGGTVVGGFSCGEVS